MESILKDPALAPSGHQKLDWAESHMPVLKNFAAEGKRCRIFAGQRITICLHIEAKTGLLALTLQEMGAEVSLCACNPLSTQDDVVAALCERGIAVFGVHGADDALYTHCIEAALEHRPQLLIDDGGDLVHLLHHQRRDLLADVIGGCEETTTGLNRLRAMAERGELTFPMIAVNDADCKHLFDNRYGTGQSVLAALMSTTNLLIAGQTVVVAGYGWCGRGLAMRAQAMGARVIVTEIDAVKALEATMDGYEVMPMLDAAPRGDFFITVTGNCDVLRREHFERLKDGAVLCNAGHFDIEISKADLAAMAHYDGPVRENIEGYTFADGRRAYLLGEGRLVNLACGQGHPAEIMDMSFAVQVGSLQYLAAQGADLPAAVLPVPRAVDEAVASMKLAALQRSIDVLTPAQEAYWLQKEAD